MCAHPEQCLCVLLVSDRSVPVVYVYGVYYCVASLLWVCLPGNSFFVTTSQYNTEYSMYFTFWLLFNFDVEYFSLNVSDNMPLLEMSKSQHKAFVVLQIILWLGNGG